MNSNQLKIFIEVVEMKSLSEVARKLNIKQPTVSFHLKSLQESLAVQLFKTKSFHNVELTEAGQELYKYALRLTSINNEAMRAMNDYKNYNRGSVHIGATHTTATYLVVPKIQAFKEKFNDLSINLDVQVATKVIDLVKSYKIDFGLISQVAFKDPDLNVMKVMNDNLVISFSRNHPFMEKETLVPSDLNGLPMIHHEMGSLSRMIFDDWAKENGVNLNIKFETSGSEVIKESIMKDFGFGVLSQTLVKQSAKVIDLHYRPIPNWKTNREIYIIYRKDKLLTKELIHMIDILKDKNISHV
ncbi:MAG TPA: LysR family transcriptional regulator [Aliicoccus persicus]|uniref:LysR family transcriptional regulator n=1 Tax=Aliicoccus persicus TaxID=930138 RepID=A0A921B665_9STAP|nr:LysR family transcriptional regulator [Aliicoccus persicus]